MDRLWQFDPAPAPHVSPLGCEHIDLTGDYTWHTDKGRTTVVSPSIHPPLFKSV